MPAMLLSLRCLSVCAFLLCVSDFMLGRLFRFQKHHHHHQCPRNKSSSSSSSSTEQIIIVISIIFMPTISIIISSGIIVVVVAIIVIITIITIITMNIIIARLAIVAQEASLCYTSATGRATVPCTVLLSLPVCVLGSCLRHISNVVLLE